jgi:penicillin G amidase
MNNRNGPGIAAAVCLTIAGTGCALSDDDTTEQAESASAARRARLAVTRDDFGVPHVFSETVADLYFGAGYVEGQDRLWQTEIFYRTAAGRLAELLGPDALQSDQLVRLLFGSRARISALLQASSPAVKTIIASYVAGLNTWVSDATMSGQLPLEYGAFGLTPHIWTPEDVLATYTFFTAFNGSFGADELDNAQAAADLVQRLGPQEAAAVFADTHTLDDPSARTTVPVDAHHHGAGGPPFVPPPRPPSFPNPRQVWAPAFGGNPTGASSNAVVLAPCLSASGHALMLAGPQVGYATPQVFHEIGLHGGGIDVTGVAIAGSPLVSIGVTPRFGWTVTTGGTDTQDIYAEPLNPSNPGQYIFQGQPHDFACRVESFGVAGLPDAVPQTMCESVHGPVLAVQDGLAFALRDAARGEEARSFEATSQVPAARSLSDVQRIVAKGAFNFNFLYADTHGNIAYWHTGKVPVRAPGANPFLPQPGDGSSEWQGFVPFNQLPQVVNPRQGYLVSWNNKPAAGWQNSTFGLWAWGPVHRVNHLMELTAAIAPHSATLRTLEDVNRNAARTVDTPSGSAFAVFAPTVLTPLLARVNASADARVAAALVLLRGWDQMQIDADGDGRYDSPAVALFNTWWQKLVSRVFADELGPNANIALVGNLVERLLEGASAALPLAADYLDGETVEAAVTGSLISALDALAAQFGAPPAGWLQPIAEIVWAPIGAAGVPNTPWANRGTYNQLVELDPKGNRAENVLAPGQSGDLRSAHFADQLGLYASFQYKPMPLGLADIRAAAETTFEINPRR